jgi:signal transduction histidine kinase/ActR/RegA family two-component response regulator
LRDSTTAPLLSAYSRSSAINTGPPLESLIGDLADRKHRAEAATRLAQHLGACSLIVLLPDPIIGAVRPAPGFPQTLPGGPSWHDLLRRCCQPGEFTADVAFGNQDAISKADVYVTADGAAIVLIGGQPRIAARELAVHCRLLLALLGTEGDADTASSLAVAANDATQRAQTLAVALDGARKEVSSKAKALHEALTEAARLNGELHQLNETLEQRVEAEISERQTIQEALRQAQKMEAVGQLTGGIAHDFNNMLAIIIGSLDIATRRLRRGDGSVERYLQNANEGATRAATLTKRLLAFSRQSPLSPEVLGLNALVGGMSELLRRTLGEHIHLETVLAGGLWLTHVDPNQLENAVLNLAVNARDAMPEGGRLTIETSNAFLDEDYAAREIGVSPGQYVMVAVTDDGGGIPADTLEKVFDPFFTTKPVGKGTGLGLSMIYGFAKQSGGHVKIYSELGRGTTVKIYLRRYFGSLAEATVASGSPLIAPPASLGETILVVEDEDRVRQMSVEALRELGYTVHAAASGEEALRVFERLGPVDILFTDIVMAGMTGRQLADALHKTIPTLKVLYTTGYTRNAIVHNGVVDPSVAFLPKPFSVDALAVKIRAVLDAKGVSAD